jgi:hypothetical protein
VAAVALLRIDPARGDLPKVVEECLSHEDAESRLYALQYFQQIAAADESALETLRWRVRRSNGYSSILAATIVLRAAPGDVYMTQLVRELLADRNNDVWYPFEHEIDHWGEDLLRAIATCPEAADAALPAVLTNLSEPWRSKWALDVLGRIGGRAGSAVDGLTMQLDQQDDTEGRRVAATALGRIGPAAREAGAALLRSLRDPRAVVRAAAAESLGRIGLTDAAVRLGLESCLADEFIIVRRNAVVALGQMGAAAKPALASVDRLLDDPNPVIRRDALEVSRRIREAK